LKLNCCEIFSFFVKIAKGCDLGLSSTSSEEIYLKIDFSLNSKIILGGNDLMTLIEFYFWD
jgi:hypothetical protein